MSSLSRVMHGCIAIFFMALFFLVLATKQTNAATTENANSTIENTEKTYSLDEVTVTAQKRDESLQDVPISISYFSEEQLENAGIEDTADLVEHIPNVYMKYAEPENTIIIRGVTSFHSSLYSPASVYVDDVNYPMQYMHNAELFDIDHIEVLKGPQGALYGRNTESGVIKISTKQPDNEFTGKIFGQYGSFDAIKAGANISGPLVSDEVYMGMAVQTSNSNGYVTNTYDDNDRINKTKHVSGRGTLRWTPSEAWDISLAADFLDYEDGYGMYRFLDGPHATKRHEINVDYPDNNMNQNGNGQTLKVAYKGDSFDVLSVTGNRYYKRSLLGDRDGTPTPGQYFDFSWKDEILSQEFRLTSNDPEDPFQWLFGLYGFVEKAKTLNQMSHLMMGHIWDNQTDIDILGAAAFSQVTYTLWDRLHLTAGLRYDHHDLDGKLDGGPSYLTPAGQSLSSTLQYDEMLPKFAISYDVNDSAMLYATAAKGYLIGGFNYVSAYSQQGFTYDPEYTWNYELGIKTSWFDNRLLLNAAAFYIDIQDKQVFETDLTIPVPGAQNIRNAAKAHSMGCEIELQARPVSGLDINAGFGFTEAKIDDWTAMESGGVQYDYKGKYLTYYPRTTANIGVQYSLSSGIFARIDFLHTGETYCDNKNLIKQDGHQEFNLRLGYIGENIEFAVWSKNIFDEKYYTYMTHYGANTLVVDGDPRTFGATLTYRF